MKSNYISFNPLMKISPSQSVTSSRPTHETSQINTTYKPKKVFKNEMTENNTVDFKK